VAPLRPDLIVLGPAAALPLVAALVGGPSYAVLLMRCAARGETAPAPWLAVWGLVTASSAF
jgi:hypothetical protein